MTPTPDAPLTERRYLIPLVLITSLFFLWAFGVNLNDILIPHFKKLFQLNDFQSSLIQVAFFGGYFLAAFPAGRLMERIGYKKGILAGLTLCAIGALLFVPASSIRLYGFFLLASFVLACGQSFLEVAANPYATILGPAASADRRLNFAQSFNALGAVVSPWLGRNFILTGVGYSAAQLAAMTTAQVEAYRASEAATVRGPYMFMSGIFLFVALLIGFAHLPDVKGEATHEEGTMAGQASRKLLSHRHLILGVLAQFLYVGAQVGVTSFVIRFTQASIAGTNEKTAANYLLLHLLGFWAGRVVGSALMRTIPSARLLSFFAAGCLCCAVVAIAFTGSLPVWAVVCIGFFHSIMFPTIFALSIKDLGSLTKRGSSLLVMAIIGGAVFPPIMGRISDATNIRTAFCVPIICYVYILYFALSGYKPANSPEANTGAAAIAA